MKPIYCETKDWGCFDVRKKLRVDCYGQSYEHCFFLAYSELDWDDNYIFVGTYDRINEMFGEKVSPEDFVKRVNLVAIKQKLKQ